jgi:hypothetical protein
VVKGAELGVVLGTALMLLAQCSGERELVGWWA